MLFKKSKKLLKKTEKKAWVISVDMGYGHARAAYPLKDIAFERIITANSDKIVSLKEKKLWIRTQSFFEWLSRMREFPIIGPRLFSLFDYFQSIAPFYPEKDLSRPTLQTNIIAKLLKQGLCKSLINYIKNESLPIITTFFTPAIAAMNQGLSNVYCVVTDSDITRAWVCKDSSQNTITYLAPSTRIVQRLKQYGIQEKHIIFTGFPLPKENLGGENLTIAKKDFVNRLPNLDPKRRFIPNYQKLIYEKTGVKKIKDKSTHPLTITYAVGGAGAQKEAAKDIVSSLKDELLNNELRINLVAGTRLEVADFFKTLCRSKELRTCTEQNVNIIFALTKKEYFERFNEALHTTDILWTKPSELSFYAALGIPIIIAPPLGAHEIFNKNWLLDMGAGKMQENPKYTKSWLFDWLKSGKLAEAAWDGFTEAPQLGTYRIESVLFDKAK